jgi:hypothetical protein
MWTRGAARIRRALLRTSNYLTGYGSALGVDPGAERRLPFARPQDECGRDARFRMSQCQDVQVTTSGAFEPAPPLPSIGELAGGSAPIRGRPWVLMLIVSGFGSKHAALAFEAAWQKPHSSRHTARMWSALGLGKCSCRTSVEVRRRALALLLEHGVLRHESLSVCEVC